MDKGSCGGIVESVELLKVPLEGERLLEGLLSRWGIAATGVVSGLLVRVGEVATP